MHAHTMYNVTYLGRIYRTCTVGNSGSIAPNCVYPTITAAEGY